MLVIQFFFLCAQMGNTIYIWEYVYTYTFCSIFKRRIAQFICCIVLKQGQWCSSPVLSSM